MNADRELKAEVHVAAPVERVWAALADLSAMARRSPETMGMVALKPGGLRVGQWYLGINRRKAFVWPTRNVVREVKVGESLVWDTTSSGARWIFELTPAGAGTRVVHRRPVLRKLTPLSGVVAGVLLGGVASHADELEAGMARTLAELKAEVERD